MDRIGMWEQSGAWEALGSWSEGQGICLSEMGIDSGEKRVRVRLRCLKDMQVGLSWVWGVAAPFLLGFAFVHTVLVPLDSFSSSSLLAQLTFLSLYQVLPHFPRKSFLDPDMLLRFPVVRLQQTGSSSSVFGPLWITGPHVWLMDWYLSPSLEASSILAKVIISLWRPSALSKRHWA
jgi:hypothetical protein